MYVEYFDEFCIFTGGGGVYDNSQNYYLPENELLFCFNFLFKRSLSVLDYNFFHCGYLNRFKTIRITIFRHYRNVLPLYTLKQNLRYKYIYIIILVYTDAHYQAESTFDSDR